MSCNKVVAGKLFRDARKHFWDGSLNIAEAAKPK